MLVNIDAEMSEILMSTRISRASPHHSIQSNMRIG